MVKSRTSLCHFFLCHFVTEDSVFMSNEAEREEYVLNERGRLYKGSANNIYSSAWNFGQVSDLHISCHTINEIKQ